VCTLLTFMFFVAYADFRGLQKNCTRDQDQITFAPDHYHVDFYVHGRAL
jgi:hypothetical protein